MQQRFLPGRYTGGAERRVTRTTTHRTYVSNVGGTWDIEVNNSRNSNAFRRHCTTVALCRAFNTVWTIAFGFDSKATWRPYNLTEVQHSRTVIALVKVSYRRIRYVNVPRRQFTGVLGFLRNFFPPLLLTRAKAGRRRVNPFRTFNGEIRHRFVRRRFQSYDRRQHGIFATNRCSSWADADA